MANILFNTTELEPKTVSIINGAIAIGFIAIITLIIVITGLLILKQNKRYNDSPLDPINISYGEVDCPIELDNIEKEINRLENERKQSNKSPTSHTVMI